MVYADYAFYTDSYFGTAISEADFPRLALRGSQYLDYITQGRAAENAGLEALQMACCALAEQYQTIDAAKTLAAKSLTSGAAADGMELQSQTVGSWSRSYRAAGDSAQSAARAAAESQGALYAVAMQYLAHTGLLYRGGRCCR